MLDSETKRRIDTARDILVGKLPDPKSQVEQITIALIYKFMDDMDEDSEALGGKPVFFTGEFSKYSWSKIFDPRLGGHEIFELYTDAIQKMNQNPNIPQLFRDIFKNAYLPYRDPETLKSFLKVINDFNYDHSEKLGDAFEYLLSVMDSQGEAGQFRTPRHIIDFIVSIVKPKKSDMILDPACGTAGFLISSYKHILKDNTENGQLILTPEEKKRLTDNFVGYDISPDMVRLSLVNMYLHTYPNPHIYEHDTLTSEERWNDVFDVIMANPPFMSPKGGIKPHKRFAIKANRSEVLFVDYIAEHLTPNGRAGVIVPEGIIFQSGIAYKDLRKMLLEHFLYAVVSLPIGVFNPYSGIKTSILFMDKNLVKKSRQILFVRVTNDGFSLGAQRREVRENDLPLAFEIISRFQNCIKENKDCELTELERRCALILDKECIKEDYSLNIDRYRPEENYFGKWALVELGEVCEVFSGSTPPRGRSEYWNNGTIPWFTIDDIRQQGKIIRKTIQKITQKALDETSVKLLPKNAVLLCCTASIGEYAYSEIELTTNQQFNGIVVKEEYKSKLLPKFLFWLSSGFKKKLELLSGTTSFGFVSATSLKSIKIPLPPIEIQTQIVSELESYQRIVEGAKEVVESYSPKIDESSNWESYEVGQICDITTGKLDANEAVKDGLYPFFTCSKTEIFRINEYAFDCEALLLSGNNASGDFDVKYYNGKFNAYQRVYIITIKEEFKDKVIYPLLNYYLQNSLASLKRQSIGGLTKYLTRNMITSVEIKTPSLETQKQIFNQIDEEQKLVDSNNQLIEIFEKKIKNKIAAVWGENE